MVLEAGGSPRCGWKGVLREDLWLGVEGGAGRPALPYWSSSTQLCSHFFKRATAPTLRSCKGVINLPCNDVITLMDTGLVEHFISTRAFYIVSSSLYTTSSFPQTPPPLY